MLALIEFALVPIPLVFYRYGHKIRMKSTLIRQMREDREKLDGKKRRAAERLRGREGGGEKSGAMGEKKDMNV